MVNLSSKSRRRLIADGLKTDMMMVTGVELWLAQKKTQPFDGDKMEHKRKIMTNKI